MGGPGLVDANVESIESVITLTLGAFVAFYAAMLRE